MSKRFLGLLLPFLLVYGIDDLDLDGLDLPQVEQEAKSEEKKPDEVEKVVVPLSEAKEAEAAEESKGAEEAKAGAKSEESAEAAQKEASQSSQNPATQESKGAEKQAAQPQGEKPETNQTGEQKTQGQGVDEAAKAGAQSGDASAPNVASDMPIDVHDLPTDLPADLPADMPADAKDNNAESKDKNAAQGADTKAKSEVALPEELQMQNQEIPAPAPQPKAEDKLPEGFGPEDLPPEALDGVSGGANPAAANPAAQNAAPNAISPAGGAAGAASNPASPNPALPNDPNAPTAPQGATPPANGQPKVQLEENAKQSDKKQDGKEVTFTQEDFFELDEDDFMLEKRDGGYVLKVLSLDLEAFVNGKSYNEKNQVQTFGVNENYTQITSHDGKIQEYKFFQKAGKKNTILNRVKVPLKKLDFDSYKLVMKDTPSFFDTTNCKVGIKKELRATLNQNKEVIIDLDIRRELRNTTKFKLFLDCPR